MIDTLSYCIGCNLPANIYLFKVNNRNTSRSGVFIVSFEHISNFFSNVFIVDFGQVNVLKTFLM